MVKLSDTLGRVLTGSGEGTSVDGNWLVDNRTLVGGGGHQGSRELGSWPHLGGCCALGSHESEGGCELVGSHAFVGNRGLVSC